MGVTFKDFLYNFRSMKDIFTAFSKLVGKNVSMLCGCKLRFKKGLAESICKKKKCTRFKPTSGILCNSD